MDPYLKRLLLLTSGLILASVAGIARYRFIDGRYKPFVGYVVLGLLFEVISYLYALQYQSNIAPTNVFILLELLILNYLFTTWSDSNESRKWCYGSAVFFCLFFIGSLIKVGIDKHLIYFNVLCRFYLLMLATGSLAQRVVRMECPYYRDLVFIICCGVILYFSNRIIIESFWFYGLQKSSFFRIGLFAVQQWINIFVNLMYLYAILWIPKKPAYLTFS
ncbi:MAG: hypothetical protein EOO46_00120 [Flavobacterium sp.]|nr:MAG: hypothetical protein EOO46_00120 [Flavobacterium sp.]